MNEILEAEPAEEAKKSNRRRIVAIVVTSLVLIGIILLLLYLRSAPAKGIIHQGAPTASGLGANPPDTLVPYKDNPYLAYSYISSYHLSTTKLEQSGVISRAEFIASRPAYKQLEVYVIKETGIDQDSSVHYRRLYSNLYKEEKLNSGGLQGAIFTRTDQGFERIAFFSNGAYVGVVAMTMSADLPSSMSDFSRVLGTVQWK